MNTHKILAILAACFASFFLACEIKVEITNPEPATTPISGSFSYTNITAIKDTQITETSPQWSADAPKDISVTYAISPMFADTLGLKFDTKTGTISGTPKTVLASTTYTIIATGTGAYTGSKTTTLNISISESAIGTISYATNSIQGTKDTPFTASLQWSDDAPKDLAATYTISPVFADTLGLKFDTKTGTISGTPKTVLASTKYTISAIPIPPYTGSPSTTLQIKVNIPIAGTFSYTDNDIEGVRGTSITSRIPSWQDRTDTSQTISYAINTTPATEQFNFNAATGLDFDTATGIISGTPTVLLANTNYTITATAIAPYTSSKTTTVQIEITTPITGSFSYTAIIGAQNTTLTEDANLPRWTGAAAGQTVSYSAVNLPAGLNIDSTTGAISGVPVVRQESTNYIITATGTAPYTSNKTATVSIAIALTPLVSYSSIASGTKGTSSPVFDGGIPTGLNYSIATTGEGISTPVLPNINNTTGEIIVDTNTTAGTYVVNISGSSYSGKDKIYFYVTTRPTSTTQLKDAIIMGVLYFGNTADYNYILTDGLIDMGDLFFGKPTGNDRRLFNSDISQWDPGNVTVTFISMFEIRKSFNGDISQWDTSNVTDMYRMFGDATAFNGDISAWDTSSVTNMYGMFDDAAAFNGDISAWDTSSVTNMGFMFVGAAAFNDDISAWDISSATDMSNMFENATAFTQNLDAWAPKLHASLNKSAMFGGSGLAGNEPCWYSSTDANEC